MAQRIRDLQYWRDTFPQLIEELKELFSDVEHPMYTGAFSRSSILTEKPDIISQELWDNFFIKDKQSLKNTINRLGSDHFLFLEIEGITYAFFRKSPSICVAFPDPVSGDPFSTPTNDHIDSVLRDFYGNNWDAEDSEINDFMKMADEVYGEENVLLTYPLRDAHWGGTRFPSSMHRPYLIVRHDDFWVEDKYGLRMKVINGLSYFRFNLDGTFSTSSASIGFGSHMRDAVAQAGNIVHPHVPSMSNYSYVRFKSVCKGRNSPINNAISAYVDNKSEETLFNLLLNYNNLLTQEDEEGTPHVRMRSAWLKSSNQTVSVRRVSDTDIYDAIHNGIIKLVTNTTDSTFKVTIDESTITDYIESVGGDINNGVYLLKPTGGTYYKETRDSSYNSRIYCHINFNGDELPVGICEHDPDRFDMSAMDERSDTWKSSSLDMPNRSTIDMVNRKIQTVVNLKLITENDDKSISKQEIQEELLGITQIGRNSDIGDIVQTAGSD